MFNRIVQIQSRRQWIGTAMAAGAILVLLPLSNMAVPSGSFLHLPDYMVLLLGKFLCYAMVAVAMGRGFRAWRS